MIACGLLLPLLSILAGEWRPFLMAREEKTQTPYDKKAQVDNKGCKLYLCTCLCVVLLITPLLLPPPLFLVSSHFSTFYYFFFFFFKNIYIHGSVFRAEAVCFMLGLLPIGAFFCSCIYFRYG